MSTTIETLKNSNGAMLALAAIAFLITAVLVFFIIRMLIGGRLRMPGGRARQARLGIVDAFDLDRQRQLILVRRDNTEHLIMIGGPNDLLIESEIVRIEARDLRRDKPPEFVTAAGDGRIPAPFAPQADRAEQPGLMADPAQLSLSIPPEPLPPLPLPVSNQKVGDLSAIADEPAAQRTPTFPLPPRRPPPPERRLPPRAPEAARPIEPRVEAPRMDGAPTPTDIPARPIVQGPAAVIDTAPPLSPLPPAPLVAPAPATPRATPPSFLKPLPPRPPIRPLVRSNPRPQPGTEAAPQSSIPGPPAAPMAPTPPPVAEAPQIAPHPIPEPVAAPAAPASSPAEPKDALESLEEEMAKLLGRGPGA